MDRDALAAELLANLRSNLADEGRAMDQKLAHTAQHVRPSDDVELDPRLDLDGNFVDPDGPPSEPPSPPRATTKR